MGDFFVDDQFYDHPKALRAGEDAANLAVRAFAWAHRHNTGRLPKNALHTLTGKPQRTKHAEALVYAGLWEDEGDCWHIHDWEIRNAKSIAKREQSRRAAKARWSTHSERNADAYADASVPQSGCNALPTKEPRNQGTKEQIAIDLRQQEQAVEGPVDNAAAAVDKEIIDQALEQLLARRMMNRAINDHGAYRAVTLPVLRAQHAETLAALDPGVVWTPGMLADWLEPVPSRPARPALSVVPEPVSSFEVFHPLDCVCAGQRTDRTCSKEGA